MKKKQRMIDPNEASRIMDTTNKGEDWFEDFNFIDDELGFVADALDVSVVCSINIEGAGKLGSLLNDLEDRTEKVRKRFDKLRERLHERGRLGSYMTSPDAKEQLFIQPTVTIKKTPLGWRKEGRP